MESSEFVGVVVVPPINYLLGGPEVAQFYPYVDLIWSLLLLVILIYYNKGEVTHVRINHNNQMKIWRVSCQ